MKASSKHPRLAACIKSHLGLKSCSSHTIPSLTHKKPQATIFTSITKCICWITCLFLTYVLEKMSISDYVIILYSC